MCILIITIILKHYFFGYIHDLRFTYEVYQAYLHRENDSFQEGDNWINEKLFSDFIDENVTTKIENVNTVTPLWENKMCSPILSKN